MAIMMWNNKRNVDLEVKIPGIENKIILIRHYQYNVTSLSVQ